MPYVLIENFKMGVDRRKSATSAEPGSLRELTNAFVTAGGEIEKRKVLTGLASLPAGNTHGLAAKGNSLVVFGTLDVGLVGALPPNTVYERLTPTTGGLTINRIEDVQLFGGKLYVVATLSDNNAHHFYDGTEVPAGQVYGSNVRTHKQKMYCVDGVNLRFSAINDVTDWTVGAGAGLIDVSTEDATSTDLVGLEPYYSYMAVLARTFIQVWAMDPDPAKSTLLQTLNNIGLVAPHAAAGYGNGDVLFLSDTGIRSIRARDASLAAVLNDVGSPIDALIQERRATLTPEDAKDIRALVDPLTGHFWLVWGDRIFVLAIYPNGKINAWSVFNLNQTIDYAVTVNSRIAFRAGETLYLYGATDGVNNPFDPNTPTGTEANQYDATSVVVETPYLDAGRPASNKRWTGLDVTCVGTWNVFVNPDPNAPGAWTQVGQITRDTWGEGRIPVDVQGTHMAVRLSSVGTGKATLAQLAMHFEGGAED